ncbi:MAG: NAD(P)-binding domain-containing protein, partial [Steroidobacteraceae bacterium]
MQNSAANTDSRPGTRPRLAVLGGTGALGSALAKAWATSGYAVTIGSRTRDKALEAAARLKRLLAGAAVEGDDLTGAAA